MRATILGVLLIAVSACGPASPLASPTPAVQRTPAASPSVSPRTPTAITSATATPRPSPSAAPTPSATVPPDGSPPGYASSCASAHPWGRQVTRPFVCIESPRQGERRDVKPGDEVVVRGYAGGSFENNVVLEAVPLDAARIPRPAIAQGPLTYEAPDAGMPGAWEWRFRVPNPEPGTVSITAHFESPKDGARVAEARVEVVLW